LWKAQGIAGRAFRNPEKLITLLYPMKVKFYFSNGHSYTFFQQNSTFIWKIENRQETVGEDVFSNANHSNDDDFLLEIISLNKNTQGRELIYIVESNKFNWLRN
jgi:hypothetical protein